MTCGWPHTFKQSSTSTSTLVWPHKVQHFVLGDSVTHLWLLGQGTRQVLGWQSVLIRTLLCPALSVGNTRQSEQDVCACVRVCVCACVRVCVYVCVYKCMCEDMYMCACACVRACVYVCINV